MIEWYRSIMALHVIAVISWMAGILYLFRLLVYASEKRGDHTKVEALLQLMSRRLWKAITLPAMIITWIAGLTMVHLNPALMHMSWFLVKFCCVLLLSASTIYAGILVGRVQARGPLPEGRTLRFLNEVPTLLMVVIVIMVIVRPF